jgi:dihydropyrimidinase
VIYDPEDKGVFSASTQTMNCDYNGFEGMERDGKPAIVTVRGKVQVKDGKFVGEDGRGRLAPRDFTG